MSPSTTWSSPRRSSAGWSSWSGRSAARTSAASCDGIICSTPSGSTAYNLSNSGPVLVWGIDAMATTFVAPHSLHARPLVVPRGKDVVVVNRTPDVAAVVLVDEHRVGEAGPGGLVTVRLGAAHTLLATLPEATFVSATARASRRSGPRARRRVRGRRSVGTSAGDGCAKQGAGLRSGRAARGCGSRTSSSSRGRARARAGLVALTGETGARKTIVTQAIGLLLGAKADATSVGAGARGVRRGGARRSRRSSSTRRGLEERSATCARRTRPVSSSRGGSRRTGARARSPGGAQSPATTSSLRPTACSCCPGSSRSAD